KPTESEGFEQIIDFLNGSSISYALTASPTIRTSCITQFWTTAKVKNINDEVRIQALIDENRVNIKESSILCTLKLDDAEGTSCLANAEIFDGLAKMGYKKLFEKINFYKAFFSLQWKFLIHTILQFKNIEVGVPFFMFPRFVQLLIDHQLCDMSHHNDIYENPFLTKKVFANMKRVGTGFSRVVIALFDNMLVSAANKVGLIQDDVQPIPTKPSTSKPHKKHKSKKHQPQAPKVPSLEPSPEHRLPSPFMIHSMVSSYKERIENLEGRVEKLEDENRVLKELHNVHSKVDTAAPVVEKEKSFKQGRIIADVEINLEEAQAKLYKIDLEHSEKVLSMQDVDEEEPADVEEVLKVVKASKLMTGVVTTAGATTTAEATNVNVPRRRRGVIIQDPEETTSTVVMHSKIEQDEAFARQLKVGLNTRINWNAVMEQVKRSERLNDAVMKYQALKRNTLTEAQARKNMIIYLKNMAGFKMNYFKRMTYSEIRPLFERHYNNNQDFLEEVNKEVTLPEKEVEVKAHKREGESLENEISKKQKMDEEAKELRSHLRIVPNDDDDVYTEATPLASKILIVDYKIHFERNRPYFKIIRADERFEKTEPKNYSDNYLLKTLKIMFEQPDVEASVWRDQKGRYGLAKRCHLTHFTLEQMLNNVRLEVEEESEMSLELLREDLEALWNLVKERFTLDQMLNSVRLQVKEEKKAAKRRKLNKEVEDLKRHLEIVPDKDDDVYTKATPLARKVPVVDYEIIELNNKPYYKIIRADGTHQLYINFLTLLKNFDREDLKALWNLVKERYTSSNLEKSKKCSWSSKGQELEAVRVL
nr:hypothetical protein [Tanacetum cinerariifolium]